MTDYTMKLAALFACLLTLACGGCQTVKTLRTEQPSVDEEFIRRLGTLLQTDAAEAEAKGFSPDEVNRLRGYKFLDSLSTVMMHPRFYDKIKDTESRQIERFYLDYIGNVSHSKVIFLPEKDFWQPIKVIADYYLTFQVFPIGLDLHVPTLQATIDGKKSEQ